ncbi:PTS sugar transporter subunit IIA [Caldibacillus debilis]|uniref:PTS system, galactitol-specific IIA component n=1 Tax=Caldibacillus debilis TaxID=301148 RepID=A0A150LEX1_9BACI|nr:PTS sugar transporter subunit IIA [Caldibacillus debilis]KYD10282.1 PTS system, galactitol-specific IIA component [Caldibacillus debilis]
MGLFNELFSENLVFLDFPCRDKYEFFEKISRLLLEKGYVKSSFQKALVEREEKYPTGLRTTPFHVAIPHTDPANIVRPFIAVIRPERAVEFNEMGMSDEKVEARFLFLLGLNRGEGQTELLSRLIHLFNNREAMERLIKENDRGNVIRLLKENIN